MGTCRLQDIITKEQSWYIDIFGYIERDLACFLRRHCAIITSLLLTLRKTTSNMTSRCIIPLKITVVGAGLGGLAAAVALHLSGHEVQVLEGAPQFGEIGAGIQVPPNCSKALKWLGVFESVAQEATWPGSIAIKRWKVSTCNATKISNVQLTWTSIAPTSGRTITRKHSTSAGDGESLWKSVPIDAPGRPTQESPRTMYAAGHTGAPQLFCRFRRPRRSECPTGKWYCDRIGRAHWSRR